MSGIDRLRRLADEATRGPWRANGGDVCGRRFLVAWDLLHRDADYVAAMNPEVGRALLDVVEELRIAQRQNCGCVSNGPALDRLDALLDEQEQA